MSDRVYSWPGNGPTEFNGDVNVDLGNLGVKGDVLIDDGGTFTTTLQCVTPTAARVISLPDATGTVGLIGGSSGQITYNNAGAYAGVSTMTFDGTSITLAGRLINSYTSVASSPAKVFTGTWFTGGTATTTKPHFLIEPTGATSTAWSTSGTGLGVNAATGFTGRLLDLQINGTSEWSWSNTTFTFADANDIAVGTSTGTKIGTATSQKIGFFNATPVVQQTITTDLLDSLQALGLIAGGAGNTPLDLTSGAIGSGTHTLTDAADIVVGSTTGTKIGTATTQKLGFYNKAPVVQPTAVADATDAASVITQLNALLSRMRDLGLIAT